MIKWTFVYNLITIKMAKFVPQMGVALLGVKKPSELCQK